MKLNRISLTSFGLALACSGLSFTTFDTKWDVGPNAAEALAGNEGTAGYVTWSIMGAGLGMQGFENHGGATTTSLGALVGTASLVEEVAMIQAAFATWSAVANITAVMVADGGVNGGALQSQGAHLGDIRIGAIGGMGGNVLAHAYQPGTEATYGPGGTIAGDLHMNNAFTWADAPNENGSGSGGYDFQTVMLHEIGHSLGLRHTDVSGSSMEPIYAGARRSLSADDIAGMQFIYGEPVPEPATMLALGAGVLGLARRRRQK